MSQVEDTQGLLLRLDGDAVVPAGQHVDAVIVADGDALVSGSADSVVVVDGQAVLDGAQVQGLVVVDGVAVMRNGARVTGDVALVDATLEQDGSAVIGGEIHHGLGWLAPGFWFLGLLFLLGFMLAMTLAGLSAAALVPRGVRRAEHALTGSPGKTALASLLLWIAVPIVLAVSFATVVTIPVGLGVFVFVMPLLAFAGYLIVGIRLGDALLGAVRKRVEVDHPYAAAAIGIPLLILIGMIPFIGGLVTLLAAVLGAGAVLVGMWRTLRPAHPQPHPLPRAAVSG